MDTHGRLSKKDIQHTLEQDEFELLKTRLTEFWHEYGKIVVFAILIVVCARLLFWVYKSHSASQEAAMQTLLANAIEQMQLAQQAQMGNMPATENYQAAITNLDQLIREHSKDPIAGPAQILRGYCAMKTDDPQTAVAAFGQALEKTNDPALEILIRIAKIQASTNTAADTQASVSELGEISESLEDGPMKEMVTFLMAEYQEKAGNDDAALELYRSLPDDSMWRRLADSNVRWLETKPLPALKP